jgi:hypothetical protein
MLVTQVEATQCLLRVTMKRLKVLFGFATLKVVLITHLKLQRGKNMKYILIAMLFLVSCSTSNFAKKDNRKGMSHSTWKYPMSTKSIYARY